MKSPFKQKKVPPFTMARFVFSAGKVRRVESVEEWKTFMAASYSQPVIVKFSAAWCGPCRASAPMFEELAKKYPTAVFVVVDVDDLQDVATEEGVSSMPTFGAYRRGKCVGKTVGVSKASIFDLVSKNANW